MFIQKSDKATHQHSSWIAVSSYHSLHFLDLGQKNNFKLSAHVNIEQTKLAVGKSVSRKLITLDQFSEELKTDCTWLKLLVAELSVLQGIFGKRKEQYGTRHFLKVGVEKKANKHPWL